MIGITENNGTSETTARETTPKVNGKRETVALTGKIETEDAAHKALESMFKSAVVQYARRHNTLKEAIETCRAAGVLDSTMEKWAQDVGYSLQTFRNVMVQVRKDNGESKKVVQKDDRRIARNRQTPAERSVEDQCYAYLLSKYGSKAKASSGALKLSRRFTTEAKADKE